MATLAKTKEPKKVYQRSAETTERILAAAERMFALHGFDGVSLRTIAAEADAQLALIHYHFGGKLDLYRAVWARRFHIPELRQAKLEQASLDFDRPQPTVVRELVELFVLAPLKLLDEPGGREFLIILGRELSDPKEAVRGMVREFVGPTTKLFLTAFQTALPELAPDEIAQGFRFMGGVAQGRLFGAQRTQRQSEAQKVAETKATMPPMIEFIVGGWLQLRATKLAQSKHRSLK